MRKTSTLMAGVVAGVLATGAQANVIYNFHADADSAKTPLAQVIGGQLEITDAAYRSGSVDMINNPPEGSVDFRNDSPILNVSYRIGPIGGGPRGVSARPPSQQFNDLNYPFTALLSTTAGGGLSGTLNFRDTSDEVKSNGSADSWHVFDFGSDIFAPQDVPCSGVDLCDIGTGYWQVDPATIPDPADVPEPSTWALFGLAVLGLFGATRRRTTR